MSRDVSFIYWRLRRCSGKERIPCRLHLWRRSRRSQIPASWPGKRALLRYLFGHHQGMDAGHDQKFLRSGDFRNITTVDAQQRNQIALISSTNILNRHVLRRLTKNRFRHDFLKCPLRLFKFPRPLVSDCMLLSVVEWALLVGNASHFLVQTLNPFKTPKKCSLKIKKLYIRVCKIPAVIFHLPRGP